MTVNCWYSRELDITVSNRRRGLICTAIVVILMTSALYVLMTSALYVLMTSVLYVLMTSALYVLCIKQYPEEGGK